MAYSEDQHWQILIIDNDEEDYILTRDMLNQVRGRMIDVDWAPDEHSARQSLAANRYDAVLVDYDLGRLTGIELIREFAAQDYPPPLILYTGRGIYEIDLEALQAGATLYLAKNEISPLLLERSIRYAIERKQNEAQLQAINERLEYELEERKRAEAALRASEERFRFIAMNIQDTLIFQDQALRYIWVFSPTQPLKVSQLIGKTDADLLPAEEAERVIAIKRRVLETGRGERVELQLSPGGEARWYEAVYEPSRDANGQITGLVSYTRDITERKQTETALRESEERFRTLFEAHQAVMLLIDPETGAIVDANQAASDFYGYARAELQNMRIDQINQLAPEDVAARRRQAVNRVSNQFAFPHRLADGRIRWVEVFSSPVVLQGRPILFSIIHDITARRQAEEALREREARFRSAFANAAIGFAMKSLDWSYVDANPAYCKLTGYTLEELRAKKFPELFYPDDYDENMRLIRRMIAGQLDDFVLETRYVRKDGVPVWVRKSMSLVRSPNGEPVWVIALIEDISERKRAEQVLLKYTAELQHSNQALEDFAFIASHDLQEPLRKVQAFGNLLKREYTPELGEAGADYIERMQLAAARMQTMLEGLLTYARVSSQGRPFELVDLQEIVADALSDLDVRLEETGGQVEVNSLPAIEGDPIQLRRLFQNLIGNALKFHRPGEQPRVLISSIRAGDNTVVLEVADNGIGFEPEKANYLFMPFHRLHGKTEFEGSGMGLAICQKIVERHGGRITALGQPGRGATFRITLPIHSTPSGEP